VGGRVDRDALTESPRGQSLAGAAPTSFAAARRSGLPVAEHVLDDHLARTLRRTSYMRQGFYVVVLLVALAGQVSGAVETLHIPVAAAAPAVGALELGGIVVLANADVRRRLGERAIASRLLSAAIAAGAVAFNWLAHANHLLGAFFAGMSALGYLVWLMHTENQRRDRLRVKGDLPPTSPAYEVVEHWLRHPWLTHRARAMAKADPRLGLYESLAAARAEVRRERRQAAISKVLHRKIRSAVDPKTADIAIAVYDLDEIATRLADGADYDGLTALIAADLAPSRLGLSLGVPVAAPAPAVEELPEPAPEPVSAEPVLPASLRRDLAQVLPRAAGTEEPLRRERTRRQPAVRDRQPALPVAAPVSPAPVSPTPVSPAPVSSAPVSPAPAGFETQPVVEGSLRRRVHATLDALVPVGDERDESGLTVLVTDELGLNGVERLTAQTYVQSWLREGSSARQMLPSSR
jgi:hypothetical protein